MDDKQDVGGIPPPFEQPVVEKQLDTSKVWVTRAPDKEIMTMVPYNLPDGKIAYWRPSASEADFEVNADIAAAAINTGHFVERPGSKTISKVGFKQDESKT